MCKSIQALATYRCHTRAAECAPAEDARLNAFIQLKAPNAVEAQRLAHAVTGRAVLDVERLDR